jgi:hypothetical protein
MHAGYLYWFSVLYKADLVSGVSPAVGQKTAGQIEKETMPFWRSFI